MLKCMSSLTQSSAEVPGHKIQSVLRKILEQKTEATMKSVKSKTGSQEALENQYYSKSRLGA